MAGKLQKKDVIALCPCPSCPSWTECGEQGGFCLEQIGKSKCIMDEKGCICGSCVVKKQMGLKHGYYCTRSSEKVQSKK